MVDLSLLNSAIAAGDVEGIAMFMREHDFVLDGNRIVARNVHVFKADAELNDSRQQAKKILLNSTYGALLNKNCKFYDDRLGQSTTLSGRSIVKHMNSALNEALTGEYNHEGAACYYADTDSAYVSAYGLPDFAEFDWSNREAVVELYDAVADQVNDTFPSFMAKMFNCTLERGALIKAGRELVASKALFIKKKKYAVLMFDKENERLDVNGKPGKIKAMGLDLKRADTPKYMQLFLERLLLGILTGERQDTMYDWIRDFRVEFRSKPGWEKGTPRKVNGLTMYGGRVEQAERIGFGARGGTGKVKMPGHVKASLHWNKLRTLFNDRHAMQITDSAKVVVCKLKPNTYRMDSLAYPIDEPHLPAWFKELPFDHAAMEDGIVTQKIMNIAGVLNWDMARTRPDDGLADLFGA